MGFRSDLIGSPRLFPLSFEEPNAVRFILLDEAGYRAASFLDQRFLTTQVVSSACDGRAVRAASEGVPLRTNFIFHIGHVGSTLVSRLLGEHAQVFSLREPAILRTFAERRIGATLSRNPAPAAADESLDTFLKLLSRTWRPEQTALVKATSFVAAMAGELLSRTPSARAISLFVSPLAYLRGIFGGEASRSEQKAMAPLRRLRLSHMLGAPTQGASLSEGETIAMSWLCEMTSLHLAAEAHRGRILWLDFDRVLAQPPPALSKALAHLRASCGEAEVEALAASPWMTRYSKAPSHGYDAALRRQVLAQADQRHAAEIRRGMDWLGRIAADHALAREVLESAARSRR